EQHWLAPVDTPAFHRGAMPQVERPRRTSFWEACTDQIPASSEDSRASAARVNEVLTLFESVLAREEAELGRIDAIAGDGDHGQGMAYGSKGAAAAAKAALEKGAGARTLLVRAGEAWSESAGGTSGALWGAALIAAGGVFDDQAGASSRTVVDALDAGIDAVLRLGGAKPGDKTMVDAAAPFREKLAEAFTGENAADAILGAAEVARRAADATADITATLGRARVLGEKSVGTPDPGAISFSILMKELGQHLSD
ncbi:MAG TPA: DAK2 domain-containing protein, partial [Candidatus Brachybacterium merdigallinarum]|nr:DAK2 domain-containing protein [Candidatus Brachybacterium merdigallinarum]